MRIMTEAYERYVNIEDIKEILIREGIASAEPTEEISEV